MADLNNPTPQATPQQAAPSGTVTPSGEARQSAPASDSFTQVDVNTLPPQLRQSYDNMLRDYKEKTGKLSETVKTETEKAIAGYKQKADWYDSALQDEKLVKMINDYVQSLSASADPTKVNIPPELQQKLEKVDQIEKKLQTAEAMEHINAFAEAVNEKGEILHPDFDKYSGLVIGNHQTAGEYSLMRAAIELAQGNTPLERMENAYKSVSEVFHKIYEEGRQAGLNRIQQKIRNSSEKPSGSSSDVNVFTGDPRKITTREAMDLGKRRILVPRV